MGALLRRLWLCLMAAVPAAPMLIAILRPEAADVTAEELRQPAAAPGWPAGARDWLALPSKVDAYLQDHFGLRGIMTGARALIVHLWLNSGSDLVLAGTDGRLFYTGNETVEQSAGVIVRRPLLAQTADTIARAQAELADRGIAFLFAPAPSATTIETGFLPEWARNPGRPTEYDVIVGLLRARGVRVIDLRPALTAALAKGSAYLKYDSHWNARGVLAAFNEIVVRGGHPDWVLDPATALTAPSTLMGGDLARMLGLGGAVSAAEPGSALPVYPAETLSPPPFPTALSSSGHDGPSILIIGDSFTELWFRSLVLAHAGQLAWTHHLNCAFDWTWIDRFHPDEVWWIPAERYIPCRGGSPAHMPANATTARSG